MFFLEFSKKTSLRYTSRSCFQEESASGYAEVQVQQFKSWLQENLSKCSSGTAVSVGLRAATSSLWYHVRRTAGSRLSSLYTCLLSAVALTVIALQVLSGNSGSSSLQTCFASSGSAAASRLPALLTNSCSMYLRRHRWSAPVNWLDRRLWSLGERGGGCRVALKTLTGNLHRFRSFMRRQVMLVINWA